MRARNCMYIFTCFTNKSVKETGSIGCKKYTMEKAMFCIFQQTKKWKNATRSAEHISVKSTKGKKLFESCSILVLLFQRSCFPVSVNFYTRSFPFSVAVQGSATAPKSSCIAATNASCHGFSFYT